MNSTPINSSPDVFSGFAPWLGPAYGETAGMPRIMVLGESHWGPPEWRRSTFTQEVVRHHVFERRSRFFTKIAKLVTGLDQTTYLTTPRYHDFWNSVIFWNFVQELAGPAPRHRPSPEKWATGAIPFQQLLTTHRPEAVVVLGKELWANLPASQRESELEDAAGQRFSIRWYDCSAGVSAAATYVNHPSSPGWRYKDWQPRVATLLDPSTRTPTS